MIILRQKEYARRDYMNNANDVRDNVYNKYIAGKRRAIAEGLLRKRASVNVPGISIEERNKIYDHVLGVADRNKKALTADVWLKETPLSMKEKMAERPELFEKGYKEAWVRKPQPQQVNTPPPVTPKVEATKTTSSSPKINGKGGGWKKAVAGTLLAAPLITGGLYLNKLSGGLRNDNITKKAENN